LQIKIKEGFEMMHDSGDWHWGFGFGHWAIGIAMWVIIILAIAVLIKYLRHR
jgi:hypothetical protein